MDIYGKDKGNVSLPLSLRPRDFDEAKLKNIIVNTQKRFYEMKIEETNKRIQRLEERNQELEDNLEDTNYFIKNLQEEKKQEISGLNLQVTSHAAKVDECKKQLMITNKSRTEDKSVHIAKIININEKYENMRTKLMSQIKLLSAKTNVLEDYKSMQYILESKLNKQNQLLFREKDTLAESIHQIKRKFKIDREKLKKGLYNRLLDFSTVFQLEIADQLSHSTSRLLSENITLNNKLTTITKLMNFKEQDCMRYRDVMKEFKTRMNDDQMNITRSIITSKLERTAIAMLQNVRNIANIDLSKFDRPDYLTEEKYILTKDNAAVKAEKSETHMNQLKVSLYCEKAKLDIAKYWKQWVSDQLQLNLQMLCDIKVMLLSIKS